jgi:hypothetical protein
VLLAGDNALTSGLGSTEILAAWLHDHAEEIVSRILGDWERIDYQCLISSNPFIGYKPPGVNLENLGELGRMAWKGKGVARYD